MGREIRRVPLDWQHPRDERGYDRPLFDRDFSAESRAWKDGLAAWESGADPDKARYPDLQYWEWHGNPPGRVYYRPAWTPEEATAYQFYETTSEGTPLSPVFATRDGLRAWLIDQGEATEDKVDDLMDFTWNPAAWRGDRRYRKGDDQ